MADKRISQLIERVDIANNDVLPIVASGATTTNKVTISTIQDWMQENLDVGVTSVGITIGSTGNDVNVTGSPITTSGNITINIPTATATARGLLSPTDWSTFNGKQNSITLTTSGTSGAATLVGSTLNIPNYSTGVANAYVPYVGAIGSVTLGYNSLSASQINIDGASPTGGSYLGFKHSTSVNTGTNGYTSMYTFGTNTIAFKSVSGGDSKDFSFSMVGITPNVPGGRQYTLPDASGTLALTSDLSGYVTLNTAQTITGSKTFNSRIIGQDATLTGSGSPDTLEVTHTSGSGIAVDISKAGNGEGLRVAKTSGSGNAVTITGGLLSAEAATLTGALNGTTASFSGNVTSTGGNFRLFNGYYITAKRADGVDINVLGFPAGSNNLTSVTPNDYNLQNTGGQNLFSVSSTGAATFSGALNGTSASFSSSGISVPLEVRSTTSNFGRIRVSSTTSTAGNYRGYEFSNGSTFRGGIVQDESTEAISIFTPIGGQSFTLASTGAATFSSSVTATNLLTTSMSGSAINIRGTETLNSPFGITWTTPTYNGGLAAIRVERKGATDAADMIFYTAPNGDLPNERMRISSSGNVGIGVTPSAWSGIVRGFQVGQGASFSANTATTDAYMTSNCYYDGSTWRYIKSGEFALSYDARGGTGDYVWQTAPSGTAGAAFTFTERMRITSGGNVGIGTASPVYKTQIVSSGNALLQLNGNNTTGLTDTGFTISADDSKNIYLYQRETAATIFGTSNTERMRITSGGNVGIGTASPNTSYVLDVVANNSVYNTRFHQPSSSTSAYNSIIISGAMTGAIGYMGIGGSATGNTSFRDTVVVGSQSSHPLVLNTNDTERMRITSGGDLLINKQSLSGGSVGVEFERNSSTRMTTDGNTVLLLNRLSSDGTIVDIRRSGTQVGTISVTTTATSYNTSSDYRLKENVKPVENALSVLTQLKPCTFNFIADTDEEVMGFIAHEVQEVIPQAVTGEKDAVRIEQVEVSPAELDEEGNVITEAVIEEKEVPVYQGIDHSKLVPLLVASIQELKAEIEALKSQING